MLELFWILDLGSWIFDFEAVPRPRVIFQTGCGHLRHALALALDACGQENYFRAPDWWS
jgi:hypothetical protein